MLTPAYTLTATERVLPNMMLDFTTAVLDSRVTFTRALNTATAVNSLGKIAIVNANLPRFDYSPTSIGTCRGLLIEEARTNIFPYSEDLRNTADAGSSRPWTYTNITLTPDAVNSPDGTQNADKIVETTAAGAHRDYQAVTFTVGSAYVMSIFAKAAERTRIAIISSDGVVSRGTGFNLSNGTTFSVGLASPTSANIENYGDGWYRCWISYTPGGASGNVQFYLADNSGNTSYTGDGTSGAYMWGSDVGLGAFPTSYIPNLATGTTTRNADVVSMTGTNFSDWYNATEGTIVASFRMPVATGTTRRAISINDGTTNDTIQIALVNSSNQAYVEIRDNLSIQVTATVGSVFAVGTPVTAALAYKTNSFAYAAFGEAPGTDTSGTVPTVSQMEIGSQLGAYFNGWVSKINYYPLRLTNAEVRAVSK